ncbi:MAG: hypothetical protein O3C27_12000 [Actinomycetota bacterium]|nr:hypothetical protein [Actinomycetota bacterium]
MSPIVDDLLESWAGETQLSARSVLVTVLGDVIAPLQQPVWLSDLIALGALLGFSDRLVRTSVFRLVSEGWLSGERVGRRSRYSLTPFARTEIESVNGRIYGPAHPETGSDEWLLAFANGADDTLLANLRWLGFAEISSTVWARPDTKTEVVTDLAARLGTGQPTVALARFDNIEPLIAGAAFQQSSGLADCRASYRRFVERYAPVASAPLSPDDAFVLRTMVIHDYRRVRLADPELPAPLLGDSWTGSAARSLASQVHHLTADRVWDKLEALTGLRPDADHSIHTTRFADHQPDPTIQGEPHDRD